ncbi:hypothetical protein GCAAIG_14325 [Candidatus Electronema halotolerans]
MSNVRPNLKAFKDREDLVFVVDRFNALEDNLTSILTREIGVPKEQESFVRDIVFNNTIVSFSAKVKLFLHLRSIRNWPKIDPKDFHRLMHIRNQFAHCNPTQYIHVTMNKGDKPVQSEVKIMLESLSNAGEIVSVESSIALKEFTEIYDRLRTYLFKVSQADSPDDKMV